MTVDHLIRRLKDYANESDHPNDARESAQQIADELLALESIFGQHSISLLPVSIQPSSRHAFIASAATDEQSHPSKWDPIAPIRLCIRLPLSCDVSENCHDEDAVPCIKLSASLPEGYPKCKTAPQMQLLNRYIGSHGVDHNIFGAITRIYHHGKGGDHVLFIPGEVALYEGIEKAREMVGKWHQEQEMKVSKRKESENDHRLIRDRNDKEQEGHLSISTENHAVQQSEDVAEMIAITSSNTITERKSIFVGHAAVLKDVKQVPLILSQILTDKKVARATHPAIYAWVCKSEGSNTTTHRDCDDDGETAAGGRLAHLLDVLHLENVIVVVTRWYGGVHLGADRFKLINRAAREALEMADLVTGPLNSTQRSSATEEGKGNKK